MTDPRVIEFGKRIRALREQRGLSQEKFAALAEIDRSYMGHVERGARNVTIVKVFQIADALELDPAELFKLDE